MCKNILISGIALFVIFGIVFAEKQTWTEQEAKDIAFRMQKYVMAPMPADLSKYSENDKKLLQTLIEAGKLVDEIYWRQTYYNNIPLREEIVKTRSEDDPVRKFFFLQIGPYDRLDHDAPFMKVPAKPPTAGFYPPDMKKEEFEKWITDHPADKDKFLSPYTVIKRQGNKLIAIPYHEEYKQFLEPMVKKLRQAADLSDSKDFKKFLTTKAEALLTDNYFQTDVDWIDMKDNKFDMVFGPYEVYGDELNNLKASYEAYIEIVDIEESAKLDLYKKHLADMEANLPYPEGYKNKDAGLTAAFAIVRDIYRGGDARAGYQAVATNLPNDAEVTSKKGTKKTFWKNVLDARLNKIIVPIGNRIIEENQTQYITPQGFFDFVLMHEIAHGLGPNYVHGTKTPINVALRDLYSWIEENKADLAGLNSLRYLREHGIINKDLRNQQFVSYLGGIFRTIRFGTGEAHGKAAIVSLNYLMEKGAITYSETTKRYAIDFNKIDAAVDMLANELLVIEAEGDYERAKKLSEKYSATTAVVQASLDSLKELPVDLVPLYENQW
jgi:Peptidase family M49